MYTCDDSLEVDNVSLSGNVGANRAWVNSGTFCIYLSLCYF